MPNPETDNFAVAKEIKPGVADITPDMPEQVKRLIAAAGDGEVKLVAIVRDRFGVPKFDDPENVPQLVLDALDADDLSYLASLKSLIAAKRKT